MAPYVFPKSPGSIHRRAASMSPSNQISSWFRFVPLFVSTAVLLLFLVSFVLLFHPPPEITSSKDLRSWLESFTDPTKHGSGSAYNGGAYDEIPFCKECEDVAALPCIRLLPRTHWLDVGREDDAGAAQNIPGSSGSGGGSGGNSGRAWKWEGKAGEGDREDECDGRTEGRESALSLLKGHWVVLAGERGRACFDAIHRVMWRYLFTGALR